ncbi:MAG: cation:proton antiporter, partial [Parvibaculum sp.]
MHDALTLNSVTLLIVIALGCGFALMRLRQPAIVGYILAGVVLGPGGLGLIHSAEGIDLFAELGVLLLLFLIGLELNLKAFRSVFRIALL